VSIKVITRQSSDTFSETQCSLKANKDHIYSSVTLKVGNSKKQQQISSGIELHVVSLKDRKTPKSRELHSGEGKVRGNHNQFLQACEGKH